MNVPMSNFKTFHGPDILEHQKFELPLSPTTKVSYVSISDVSQAIVETLLDERHAGKIYNLTGPEALSCDEIAQILSKMCEKTITYEKKAPETFQMELEQQGLPNWAVKSVAELYRFQEQYNDYVNMVTKDIALVLGRPAQSFRDFVSHEIESFGGTRKPTICIVTTVGRDFM